MFRIKRAFESEVHLGLLLIVCLLLVLSMVSNYVLYRERNLQLEGAASQFTAAALSISRAVQTSSPPSLSEADREAFQQRFHLTGLSLVGSRPEDDSPHSRGHWLTAVVKDLPPEELRQLAAKLLAADYRVVTRGVETEYFYVEPVNFGSGRMLLVLSQNLPWLAFLDDWGATILLVSLIATVVLMLVYFGLSKVIFTPFRKIRETAARAGRDLDVAKDEADGVVEEYQRVINELKEKETELLRLNAAMKQRADSLEQFSEFLLQSMDTGVITLDLKGTVLMMNNASSQILGVSVQLEQGGSYRQLLGRFPELESLVNDALATKDTGTYREIEWVDDRAQHKTLGVTLSHVKDSDRQTVGISLLINDLTELTELHQNLEKQKRLAALGEMSAGLAHQLRNSMGAISGYGVLARKRLQAGGLDTEPVTQLLEETKEAEELVGRFLGFARPMAIQREEVHLSRFLSEIVRSFEVREDCKHIQFLLRGTSGPEAIVPCDPLLLKQALSNLIENGLNASRDRTGQIEISYGLTGDAAVIIVVDHGCGIPEEDRERIFTPFYSSRPGGTGLGLPLASRIVNLHDGTISLVKSSREGSEFKITLPRAIAPVTSTAAPLPTGA